MLVLEVVLAEDVATKEVVNTKVAWEVLVDDAAVQNIAVKENCRGVVP